AQHAQLGAGVQRLPLGWAHAARRRAHAASPPRARPYAGGATNCRRRVGEMPPFERNWAFFLDIDGTLLDIAATPKAVHTAKADCRLVAALYDKASVSLRVSLGPS